LGLGRASKYFDPALISRRLRKAGGHSRRAQSAISISTGDYRLNASTASVKSGRDAVDCNKRYRD
jgi:hypothetical protein